MHPRKQVGNTTTSHFQIARKPGIRKQFGISNSHHHNLIKEGLMPPGISLLGCERSVGYWQHELDQVLAFMVAGKSKDDIRTLVSHMVDQRKLAA